MASGVKISAQSLALLRDLCEQECLPPQAILDKAISEYRRRRILELANEGFSALRRDPAAWREELEERQLWDTALGDGLELEQELP